MDVKKKLAGLVKNAQAAYGKDFVNILDPYEFIADFMIANGVTVQEDVNGEEKQ